MSDPKPVPDKVEKPHHDGHRDRLRARFEKSGAGALEDYEILELMLFSALPRRDVKPLAKTLLKTFGGMRGVFAADIADLKSVKGLGDNAALFMKAVHAATQRMLFDDIEKKPVLSSWQKLIDYCTVAMAHEKREHFRVLFLNRKNQLIADEVQQTGTVDHAPVYPREVVRRALEVGATALILVHNHPSGDPAPSDSDIVVTEEIVRAARALDLRVHDHLIISTSGYVSFKAMGLLDFS